MKTESENPKGLHQRFVIRKITGWRETLSGYIPTTKKVNPDAEYFVMRLDKNGSDIEHVKACRIGIHAYADAIEWKFPQLANDLRNQYPIL